ncbi:uncharacterized protein EV420DRAFT_1643950 [Desarmillaria tabescens]|uniref:Uncharacterized protein n=1 Tax=Armillaria tabescens TaxID=1929756 RepID=A0AA39KC90_ARMTA|nr:uncharacterized protein EV420DRAFT_1643950 [Desarmillaria tabescens]KAK0457196.1 hypothetical protein EV420DRAFT_1643950 [Desarmillaria tabescens]
MFFRGLPLFPLDVLAITNSRMGLHDGTALQRAFNATGDTFESIHGALGAFFKHVDISHATDQLDGQRVCDAINKAYPAVDSFWTSLVNDSDRFDRKFVPAIPASAKGYMDQYDHDSGLKVDAVLGTFCQKE